MPDDRIRERHGVTVLRPEPHNDVRGIILIERGDHIEMMKMDDARVMTPAQARYLARKLYHLARRIEQRGAE